MIPEDFWNKNDEHQDQKFYVCFCMLESALGDYAIARELDTHNKMDWASTIYYYALVHAMRLLCFITYGDFPKGHEELARLYKNGTIRRRNQWLNKFIRNYDDSYQLRQIDFLREDIVNSFNGNKRISINITIEILKEWGQFLFKARDCRNDCNYEGLIIAHEFAHRMVTNDLKKLTNIFHGKCNIILPEIILIFKNFVDKHPRKDYWYSFLNWKNKPEGLYYFKDFLSFKLLGITDSQKTNIDDQNFNTIFDSKKNNSIISNIFNWLSPLEFNEVNEKYAEEVLNNIQLGIFHGKKSLMQKFRNLIHDLE